MAGFGFDLNPAIQPFIYKSNNEILKKIEGGNLDFGVIHREE